MSIGSLANVHSIFEIPVPTAPLVLSHTVDGVFPLGWSLLRSIVPLRHNRRSLMLTYTRTIIIATCRSTRKLQNNAETWGRKPVAKETTTAQSNSLTNPCACIPCQGSKPCWHRPPPRLPLQPNLAVPHPHRRHDQLPPNEQNRWVKTVARTRRNK
jgi:hypothetical protein